MLEEDILTNGTFAEHFKSIPKRVNTITKDAISCLICSDNIKTSSSRVLVERNDHVHID